MSRKHPKASLAGVLFLSFLSWFPSAQAASPLFNKVLIDDAVSQSLIAYSGNSPGNTPSVVMSAQAFHFLALVAHFDPYAKSHQGVLVKDRVLEHFRNLTSGGKEPSCSNPLYGWSDGPVAQSLLIIKNTPSLWNSLSEAEKENSDLLMKALSIASNWALNDGNDFKTGLGGEGGFAKNSNPDVIQGDIGIMIACSLYFGASGCNEIFTNFSFSSFISQLKERNWSNAVSSWSATGASLMEKGGSDGLGGKGIGVKVPFVYGGVGLENVNGLFSLASVSGSPKPMYSKLVSSSGDNGKAFIISGQASPVQGQLGMCYEFDTIDTGGVRSDALYCYEAWLNSVATRSSMMMMGVWGGPNQAKVETQMGVGTADLMFKLQQGYRGAYLGKYREVYDIGQAADRGYFYNKAIWDAYINANLNPPLKLSK